MSLVYRSVLWFVQVLILIYAVRNLTALATLNIRWILNQGHNRYLTYGIMYTGIANVFTNCYFILVQPDRKCFKLNFDVLP